MQNYGYPFTYQQETNTVEISSTSIIYLYQQISLYTSQLTFVLIMYHLAVYACYIFFCLLFHEAYSHSKHSHSHHVHNCVHSKVSQRPILESFVPYDIQDVIKYDADKVAPIVPSDNIALKASESIESNPLIPKHTRRKV